MNLRRLGHLLPLIAACASPPRSAPASGPGTAPATIDLTAIDRGVAPGDDFFAFANGTWLKNEPIPADRSSWGTGAVTEEKTRKRTAELVERASKVPGNGADARKVGDYYASYMDEAGIEAKGVAPLTPLLASIAKIADARALARALGTSIRADVDVLNATNYDTPNVFGLWVASDLDEPTKYSPFLLQGGLTLPDRDYYLSTEPRRKAVRETFKAHIEAMLTLAGVADAENKAAVILDLETKIARAHATREETEDVKKGNNHWTKSDFARKAPGLDWESFFTAAQLGAQTSFVVWQPRAFAGIAALVKSEPLDAWKSWLAFHAIASNAAFLPKAFGDEEFALRKVLTGTPQQPDRWKRAMKHTDDALGEVIGKLYVARYFPASEKARAEKMVQNVVAAFGRRIDALTWMSPRTKEQAKAKLAALKIGVGYPDKWRDYTALEVVRGDAFANHQRASDFDYRRELEKLGKPVDRSEWVMNPQLVNAVNLPAMNALNFPAAILQPPDFDPDRPMALDYGATGATIGHELCHSFDDTGALFDASGRLANWWTVEDYAHFRASSATLAKQFDAYRPFPDAHVNGALTSAENIADLAGLSAAYDAYRFASGGTEAPVVDGLTGDQQFFLSFAQSWRYKSREAMARLQLATDMHAPEEYRADTVRNLDAWYTAWDVKAGQKLFLEPAARVRVY